MPITTSKKPVKSRKDVSGRFFEPHDHQGFIEEGQTIDLKFCWAKLTKTWKDEFGLYREIYSGLTDFLKCKDFLHDHVVADHFNTSFTIFGYPAKPFEVKSKEDLLLIIKTSECVPIVYQARWTALVRQFEKAAGLESRIMEVRDAGTGNRLVAVAPDELYYRAPFGISLLTYLCRITLTGGVWPEVIPAIAALQTKDTGIAKTIKEYGVEKLAANFKAALEKAEYPKQFDAKYIGSHTSELHFYGGIQSTLNGALKPADMPDTAKHYGKLFACEPTSTKEASA